MNELMAVSPAEVSERIERLNEIKVERESAKTLDAMRAETNAYVKGIKENIKRAKEEFLKPFTALEEQALNILKPLEEANKEFSDRVLTQKKAVFFEKVHQEWEYLSSLDNDGVIAPFASVYDPSWYGKPEKEWKPALLNAIKREKEKGEPTTAYFVIEGCTKGEVRKIEEFLVANRIAYRKETL